MLRRRWPGIAPAVTSELLQWHQQEVVQAVLATPAGASLVTDPAALTRLDNTPYGHRLAVGRIGAEAIVGSRWGNLVIDDIFNSGYSAIWFHLDGRPQWRYHMSGDTFIRTDPLVTEVSRQVVERTRFAAALYPLLIRGLGVGMSFSPHIALVIAGIALEELAEEMQREQEGRPGRSGSEILGSAALSLLVDRVFHHLGAPSAGGAAGVEARLAQHLERTRNARTRHPSRTCPGGATAGRGRASGRWCPPGHRPSAGVRGLPRRSRRACRRRASHVQVGAGRHLV